jgi:hypothetical protein
VKKDKHEHDRNLRAIKAQMLTVGLILIVIASVLLGWDVSLRVGHEQTHYEKPNVNIKVSTSCVDNKATWPIVTGNG